MFATWPVVLDLQGILRKKAPHEPPNYPEQSRVHVSHICVTSVSYDQSCMLKIANEGPQDWPWTFNAQTHPVYINYYTPRRTTSHFQDIAQFIPIDYILNVQTGRTKKKMKLQILGEGLPSYECAWTLFGNESVLYFQRRVRYFSTIWSHLGEIENKNVKKKYFGKQTKNGLEI